MAEWQNCPTCGGRGRLAAGFYNTSPGFGATNTADELCRTCHGAMVIERPSEIERFREALRRIAEGDFPTDETAIRIAKRALA